MNAQHRRGRGSAASASFLQGIELGAYKAMLHFSFSAAPWTQSFHFKVAGTEALRAGEVTQLGSCLQRKDEDLGSDLQHPCKKVGMLYKFSAQGVETGRFLELTG